MPPELAHLSYSSISTYLLCARAWRYHYADRVAVPSAPALVFGSAWHGMVENFLRLGGDLAPLWREAWGTQLTQNPHVAWTPQQTAEVLNNEGLRMAAAPDVLTLLQSIKVDRDSDGPCIERKVELHVPGVPIPVIGYIDFLSSGVPCDIKTAGRAWSESKQYAETQPLFYLAALNQAGMHNHNWRFRHYVFVKGKTPQVQELETTIRPAQVFWLLDQIASVWRGISADVYPTNPNSWKCDPHFCDYWVSCRGR